MGICALLLYPAHTTVPYSLININHGLVKQSIILVINYLTQFPSMTIVGLCHEILHCSDTWTPQYSQYSRSIVSNLSNLGLVLHLHACMHASLNSCIKVSKVT